MPDRVRSALLLVLVMTAMACPVPSKPDAQVVVPTEDASVDAGETDVDAGRQRFDAGAPDAGFTSAAAASWCRTRALASCLRQVRCLSLSNAGVDGCVVRAAEACDQIAFSAGVDAGRLAFDQTAAVACLNGFGAGSCSAEPRVCANVFTGSVPADGGCVTATDCAQGTFCDTSRGYCPGRCSTFRREGERCSFFDRCESNLGCFPGDGGLEVCQRTKAPDAGCVDFDECGSDSLCLSGQCVKRNADGGETCSIISGLPFCEPEFFCRQGPPPAENQPAPPGICQRRAGLGGTCVGSASCLPSLRCSAVVTTGTCLARAARGERCAAYGDCEDGLFCSNLTLRCEGLPGDGGDCGYTVGSSGACLPGYFCQSVTFDDRRCERRRAMGERCDYDQQCLSNECEFGQLVDGGFGGTCQVPCSLKADAGL